MASGDCVLIISGPKNNPDKRHLFVFVTETFKAENRVLSAVLVPICTVQDSYAADKTCMLVPGDHPFIKNKSFVYYQRAAIMRVTNIMKDVWGGKTILKDKMPKDVLQKIITGVRKSPFTPPDIKKLV